MPIIIVEDAPKDKEKREKLVKALHEILNEVYDTYEQASQHNVIIRENEWKN